MADVELLPLPEWTKRDDLGGLVPSEVRSEMRAYARANLAQLQAENERLRAEVRYRDASLGWWGRFASDAVNARKEAEARAERLAEALRNSADALERLAFAIPAPNAHTPQLVELAIAMRSSALAQEDRNG